MSIQGTCICLMHGRLAFLRRLETNKQLVTNIDAILCSNKMNDKRKYDKKNPPKIIIERICQ